MYDICIIGMGIGGITAAIYAKRAGLNVLILEKNVPGGNLQKIGKIQNYPGYEEISGTDLGINLFKQMKKLNIIYKLEEVIDINISDEYKEVITKNNRYKCNKIIIATGRKPKFLGLDNEKDYLGRGVSTCAICDGSLYKNQDVAVVGSTNNALTESVYLSKICKTIYLINKNKELDGNLNLISEINNISNIKVINNVSINKINEENGKINSILLSDNKIINVKGIFIYVGYKPDTDIFSKYDITNDKGDILVDKNYMTKINNIYAIGDCIKKDVYQLITAASDGAIAISNINKN